VALNVLNVVCRSVCPFIRTFTKDIYVCILFLCPILWLSKFAFCLVAAICWHCILHFTLCSLFKAQTTDNCRANNEISLALWCGM